MRINMAKRGKSVQTQKQERFQKALVKMMIIYELPFSYVEEELFKELILEATFPSFRMPSLDMIGRDCAQLFLDEKLKLKSFIKRTNKRVCLAVDTWTSNQSVNYLCVTAHFIDNNWRLHKKIISFSPVFSNEGEDIGKAVEKCLHDWEINNVMTISIAGDASVNDVAISYLRGRLENNVLDGKFLYLRCIVDFFNTMVKECLNRYDESITRMRAAVRYVIQSPYRIEKFKRYARECMIKRECCLFLDCPANWSSTLGMLKICQEFEESFYLFKINDPTYKHELEDTCGVPCRKDWENIRQVVYFLEGFYRFTKDISELYVSSNEFLTTIDDVDFHLSNCGKQVDGETMYWALDMLWKFYEYWCDPWSMDSNMSLCVSNLLIYVADMLDPRCKLGYIKIYFSNAHKHEYEERYRLMEKNLEWLRSMAYDLFKEYKGKTGSPHQNAYFQSCGHKRYLSRNKRHVQIRIKRVKVIVGSNLKNKNELDRYLNEECFQHFDGFELLLWWKYNSERFPILSKLAKDILAIPISAVPLESAISTRGSILDDYKSSLSPSMVEALICTRDWIRKSKKKKQMKADVEEHF